MNKSVIKACLALCLFALAMTVQAANVEIEWKDPEKYRDIRGGNEPQKSFEQRVINALSGFFQEAAKESLPADQSLHLTITDVDLAGDVEYFFSQFPSGIRVMRDVYFPSIAFSYELKDANGNVLKSGEENIKDMGYRFSGVIFINNPPFNYEKRMIEDWFSRTFK
jgi:hypothetical protein